MSEKMRVAKRKKIEKLFSRNFFIAVSIFSIFFGLIGLIFSGIKINAETVNAGDLQIEYDGPGALFSESNIVPGFSVTKNINVTNTGSVVHSFSIAIDKPLGPLANVLHIKASYDGADVWDKTLSEIAKYSNSEPIIGSLAPGAFENVVLTAYLPTNVGNEYMGESTFLFDFVVGNESTDAVTNQQLNNEVVGGQTASNLISAITNLIVDRRSSRAITYAPPGTSSADTVAPPADPSGDSGDQVAGVESAKGETTVARNLCFWWLIMLIILIIFLVSYHRYIKEEKPMFWWIWPIIIAAVLYFVQAYFDKSYQPTVFCHWFWALELVVLVVYFAIDYRNENRG